MFLAAAIAYHIFLVASSEGRQVWKGMIDSSSGLSASCNECTQKAECNYHGECVNRVCQCDEVRYGHRCELEMSCTSLASEKQGEYMPLF
jgi:hypothetical protein